MIMGSLQYIRAISWFRNKTDSSLYKFLVCVYFVENMMENRPKWFEHVERRLVDDVKKRVDQIERSQTTRARGKPRKNYKKSY